jgi:hypothetical protein
VAGSKIRIGGALAGLCLAGAAAPVSALAESLKITTPASESTGKPVTITVTGQADGSHRLYVYADEVRRTCASTPAAEAGLKPASVVLAGLEGETLAAGSFTRMFSITPHIQLPVFCGYLDTSPGAAPDVKATETDPVQEYLENEKEAGPVSVSTETLPGAIEPLPVNQQQMEEFWARMEAQRRREQERAHGAAPGSALRSGCVVPVLTGHTLSGARRLLTRAHCRLGRVTRRHGGHGALVVTGQSPRHGQARAKGARVSVTLARRAAG